MNSREPSRKSRQSRSTIFRNIDLAKAKSEASLYILLLNYLKLKSLQRSSRRCKARAEEHHPQESLVIYASKKFWFWQNRPYVRLPLHVSRDEVLHFKLQLVSAVILEESFERFSCLAFIFKNSKYREAGLKHKLQSARF